VFCSNKQRYFEPIICLDLEQKRETKRKNCTQTNTTGNKKKEKKKEKEREKKEAIIGPIIATIPFHS